MRTAGARSVLVPREIFGDLVRSRSRTTLHHRIEDLTPERPIALGHGVQNVRHRHVHGTSPCCALGGGWRDLLEKHRMPAALDARTVPRLPP